MHNVKYSLYIIDFEKFIKVGITSNLVQRLRTLSGMMDQKMDFENSLFLPREYLEARFLEKRLIEKYKKSQIIIEGVSKEFFEIEVKENMIRDVKEAGEIFDEDFSFKHLGEKTLNKGYKDGVIQIYTHDFYNKVIVPKRKKAHADEAIGNSTN